MSLFKQGTLTFLATLVANIALFAYYAIAAHVLGVENYGALYTLLSLVTMMTLGAVVLGTIVAKYAATFAAVGDEPRSALLARGTLLLVLGFSAVVLLCSALLRSPLTTFLHLQNANDVPLAFLAFCSAFCAYVMRALLQGQQRFTEFSVAILIEACGRLALGAGLVFGGYGVEGGLIGYALPSVLAFMYTIPQLRFTPRVPNVKLFVDVNRLIVTVLGASVGLVSIQVLYSADLLIAKHFFDAQSAGIYSAAALLGKTSFLALSFLPTILLPAATNQMERGVLPIQTLLRTLAAAVALSAAGMVVIAAFGRLAVDVALGRAFEAAVPYLAPYLLAMSLLAVSNIFVAYRTAIHSFSFSVPLAVAALGEIGALVVYHATIAEMIWILAAGNLLAVTACAPLRQPKRINTES